MHDPLEIIPDGCYLLFRFGLRSSATLTGNLRQSHEGWYFVPVEEATAYHPLETALHCEDARSGSWKADVATRLGVSAAWIEASSPASPRPAKRPPITTTARGT
jgi:hypothetical protein